MQKIKIWKRLHGSLVIIFSLHINLYKHVYGDFTKDEKEKSQYQDTTCSEAEEGRGDRPWEVLYDNVVHPATSKPSKETSGEFSLTEKNYPFGFSGVDDCWETYPLAFMDTILCLTMILPPC